MHAEVGEEVEAPLATADAVAMEALHVSSGVRVRKVSGVLKKIQRARV